ncbi:MAG: hypothetical protein ABSC42_14810 [Tepidisphaeraceae bacterium]|jgi:hypothetical protein
MKIGTLAFALMMAVGLGFARGQAAAPGAAAKPAAPPPTQYQVEQEMRQLAADLDDPNFDEAKLPKLVQQVFQDFRTVNQNMDQDQAQQWRQSMFQQLGPVMQRNQQKMQKAARVARLLSLQEPLGASDEEFAAILPSLEKVADAQLEAGGGMARFRNFGGPPGQGTNGPQNNPNPSPVDKASADLQAAVDDPNSNPDLIKNKLDMLRDAKAKASQDLLVARNELRSLLTVRQEAVLVAQGMLD